MLISVPPKAGNHIIICGDGPLAFHVVQELTSRSGVDVLVILPDRLMNYAPQISELPRVTVMERDRLTNETFVDAWVASARAVAFMGPDDNENFHAALRAQELNPELRLVFAVFNGQLGERMRTFFRDCTVLSSSHLAAPSFVAAALGQPAPNHVRLAGRTLYVARYQDTPPGSTVCGLAMPDDPSGRTQLVAPEELLDDPYGLVLAVADGTPRNPLARQRHPLRTALTVAGGRMWNRYARGGHIIVVGLGSLGTRVIGQLHDLGFDLACVDRDPQAPGVALARRLRLPLVIGEANLHETLREAALETSIALISATSGDTVNLEIAQRVRARRENLRIVLQLFDDDLAQRVQNTMPYVVSRSVSYLAAPAFAGALLGHQVLRTIALERHVLLIADIQMAPGADIVGQTLAELQRDRQARVLALRPRAARGFDWSPHQAHLLAADDRVMVLATRGGLSRFLAGNGPSLWLPRRSTGQSGRVAYIFCSCRPARMKLHLAWPPRS